MKEKYCKDCNNIKNTKPMPRCNASKYHDPVTGDEKRLCFVERLDGIGRCGSMANNFVEAKPVEKVRKDPSVKIKK